MNSVDDGPVRAAAEDTQIQRVNHSFFRLEGMVSTLELALTAVINGPIEPDAPVRAEEELKEVSFGELWKAMPGRLGQLVERVEKIRTEISTLIYEG